MLRFTRVITVCLATAFLSGCSKTPADILLTGGNIITLDSRLPRADTIGVCGEIICFVGTEADSAAHRGPRTRVIPLGGNTVVPGLVDAHVHLLAIGDYYLNRQDPAGSSYLDLSTADTMEAVIAMTADAARRTPRGEWIIGKGWSHTSWPGGRFPNSAELLSSPTRDHPVFLTRVDAHAAWVNQHALDLAGITSETPEPAGGRILRDSQFRPTGILVDRAVDPVLEKIPMWNRMERRLRLEIALQALARAGLTTVHLAGFLARPGIVWTENNQTEENLEILRELANEGRLPVRVRVFIEAPSEAARRYLSQRRTETERLGLLTIGGIKLFADGAMGSWGALVETSFADDVPPHLGIERLANAEMQQWIGMAKEAQVQVAIHALGDLAVRQALDALDNVYDNPEDGARFRPRLEHLSATRDGDRRRLAHSGFLAVIQPGFLVPSPDGDFMERQRLGPSRVDSLFAWRSLREAGVHLVGSSDSYGQIETPLQAIYAATTRRNREGTPESGVNPSERLTRQEGLEMYTTAGAYAGFEEQFKGQLTPGRWADLVILNRDPLACTDSELLDIEVIHTMVAGRFVF